MKVWKKHYVETIRGDDGSVVECYRFIEFSFTADSTEMHFRVYDEFKDAAHFQTIVRGGTRSFPLDAARLPPRESPRLKIKIAGMPSSAPTNHELFSSVRKDPLFRDAVAHLRDRHGVAKILVDSTKPRRGLHAPAWAVPVKDLIPVPRRPAVSGSVKARNVTSRARKRT